MCSRAGPKAPRLMAPRLLAPRRAPRPKALRRVRRSQPRPGDQGWLRPRRESVNRASPLPRKKRGPRPPRPPGERIMLPRCRSDADRPSDADRLNVVDRPDEAPGPRDEDDRLKTEPPSQDRPMPELKSPEL